MGCGGDVLQSASATVCGASSIMRRPFSSSSTRSASANASSKRCSTSKIVMPISRFKRASVFKNSVAAIGSSWAVGSSKSRIFGCITSTDARFKSCFCPPESVSVSCRNQPSIPSQLAVSATRRRITCVGSPKLSAPNASSCQTLSVTIWFSGFCMTKPISAALARASRVSIGASCKNTLPVRVPCGASSRFMSRNSVVLPQPVSPHSTTNSPCRTEKETDSSAECSASGYVKLKFSIRRISIFLSPRLPKVRVKATRQKTRHTCTRQQALREGL